MLRRKEDMKDWQVEALPKEKVEVKVEKAPKSPVVNEVKAEEKPKKTPAKKNTVKKVEKMPVEE